MGDVPNKVHTRMKVWLALQLLDEFIMHSVPCLIKIIALKYPEE